MFFSEKKNRNLLIAEIILIVASVLIFRSMWLLLDKVSFASRPDALVFGLVFGVAVTIPALRYVIRQGN